MSEKRSTPLNNPPQEKRSTTTTNNKKISTLEDSSSKGRDRGVSKGGEERVKPAEAIVRCEMCSRKQKIVFAVGRLPQYHKCIGCGEIQPTDGYHVVAYGLGLPHVLSDNEIKSKIALLEAGRR